MSRSTRALLAVEVLGLAAAPTFAIMALGQVVPGTPAMCAEHASPWTGMSLMYWLMGVFHLGPWLKLIPGQRRHAGVSARGEHHDRS